jgi:hypothetical protein
VNRATRWPLARASVSEHRKEEIMINSNALRD